MGRARVEIEKQIRELESELLKESDIERRDELRDFLAYLRDKAQTAAVQEYREDVRGDYRFRQW